MFLENGNANGVSQTTQTSVRVFVKITRAPGSLENVLQAISDNRWQLARLSLQPSLDKKFYFVHLEIEGEGEMSGVGNSLCCLPEVKCAELAPSLPAAR